MATTDAERIERLRMIIDKQAIQIEILRKTEEILGKAEWEAAGLCPIIPVKIKKWMALVVKYIL